MIKFNQPDKLNGEQLVAELEAVGVIVNINTSPMIDGNGDFWLDIPTKDKLKAESIIEAHIGIDTTAQKEANRQSVLDRLGLTKDDLKALGL